MGNPASRTWLLLPSLLAALLLLVLAACGGTGLLPQRPLLTLRESWTPQQSASSRALRPKSHLFNNWCPGCVDPELCRNKFLFVVATGRSGSTTMMNMVNLVPGVYIHGENGNVFAQLLHNFTEGLPMQLTAADNSAKKILGHDRSHLHPGGKAVHRRFLVGFQNLLWTWLEPPEVDGRPPVEVRGFKEIRWRKMDVEAMLRVCPCSRWIFNDRQNLTAQQHSAFQSENSVHDLWRQRERLKKVMTHLDAPVFWLSLEQFLLPKFNTLAKWLGAQCSFTGVVHANNHGSYVEDKKTHAQCRDVEGS